MWSRWLEGYLSQSLFFKFKAILSTLKNDTMKDSLCQRRKSRIHSLVRKSKTSERRGQRTLIALTSILKIYFYGLKKDIISILNRFRLFLTEKIK